MCTAISFTPLSPSLSDWSDTRFKWPLARNLDKELLERKHWHKGLSSAAHNSMNISEETAKVKIFHIQYLTKSKRNDRNRDIIETINNNNTVLKLCILGHVKISIIPVQNTNWRFPNTLIYNIFQNFKQCEHSLNQSVNFICRKHRI